MRYSIAFVAVATPLASAGLLTASSGGATIINQCGFNIPVSNVPAQAVGVENAVGSAKTLGTNDGDNSFSTPWVQLDTTGGWSMKLDPLNDPANPMQFEYTFQSDGQIWFDMSYAEVPANIQSQFPKFQFEVANRAPTTNYYRSWNDDAYGMQTPVASNAAVTLVLCPGSTAAAAAPATSAAPVTTTQAPAPTTLQTSTAAVVSVKAAAIQSTAAPVTTSAAPAPAPTTTPAPAPAAVAAPAADDSDVAVVTEFETKVVTAVVTEIAHQRRKRHAHGHPHHGHPQ